MLRDPPVPTRAHASARPSGHSHLTRSFAPIDLHLAEAESADRRCGTWAARPRAPLRWAPASLPVLLLSVRAPTCMAPPLRRGLGARDSRLAMFVERNSPWWPRPPAAATPRATPSPAGPQCTSNSSCGSAPRGGAARRCTTARPGPRGRTAGQTQLRPARRSPTTARWKTAGGRRQGGQAAAQQGCSGPLPASNLRSAPPPHQATLENVFGSLVASPGEDEASTSDQPWVLGWQQNERNMVLTKELRLSLIKRVASEKLCISGGCCTRAGTCGLCSTLVRLPPRRTSACMIRC
jgi:hypothetical protein